MPLVYIFAVLLLVGLNGFFVACEFSLVAVRPARLQQLKEEGEPRAGVVEYLLRDLDRVLSAVQVGITMASLALGWLGELAVASMLRDLFELLAVPWPVALAHTLAITVAFLLITTLHVVLGEQVPKIMSIQRAERVALGVARPMAVFMVAFRPLVDVFNQMTNVILRAMGYHSTVGHGLVRSPDELAVLVEQARAHGILDPRLAQMLVGGLELKNVEVRQVMVPRTTMVALPANATLEQALELVRAHRRSRYPVYEGTPEQVIGVLHANDLFQHVSERLRRLERGEPLPPFDLRQLLKDCLFVPETKPLAELLEDFRRRGRHVALVVDEFGSVQGMATLADLLEPVVGQVRDEYELAPAPVPTREGELVLDGRTSLHDLEREHQIELPAAPGFETLAGFMLSRLGAIPLGGESFLHDSLRFTVLEMDGRRVARVKIERMEART